MLTSIATRNPALIVATPEALRAEAHDLARQARRLEQQAQQMELEEQLADLNAAATRWAAANDQPFTHYPHIAQIVALENALGL